MPVDRSVVPIAPAIRHPIDESGVEYAAFASLVHPGGEPEPEDEHATFTELSSNTTPTGYSGDSGEDVDTDGSPFRVDSDIYEDGAATGIL